MRKERTTSSLRFYFALKTIWFYWKASLHQKEEYTKKKNRQWQSLNKKVFQIVLPQKLNAQYQIFFSGILHNNHLNKNWDYCEQDKYFKTCMPVKSNATKYFKKKKAEKKEAKTKMHQKKKNKKEEWIKIN